MAKKIAVILFNMGGPSDQNAVKPFLFNLFNDKAIISLPNPFRFFLAKLISSKREHKAKEIYQRMGGGSPIVPQTMAQAAALEKALNKNKKDKYKTFVAMRYWHPFAYEEIENVKKFKPNEMILLPLYPHFSTTTSESSIKDWKDTVKKHGLDIPAKTICCYPMDKNFIKAHIRKIKEYYDKAKKHGQPRILFSAHGLPKKVIEKGDPYQWQVEQTTGAIVKELGIKELDWQTCYQSKVGPLEWIGPATNEEIIRGAKEGRPLVIVPIAFVSEHSETLVELDIKYRDLAKTHGLRNYFRVPALETDELFIKALAEICMGAKQICSSGSGKRICPKTFKCCPGDFSASMC